ncbi:MAG: hypothetical protein KDD39_07765 [Bdellovibrionales bacterium]|nr:hypothetical protein [Bdellovibrionales bacterium]
MRKSIKFEYAIVVVLGFIALQGCALQNELDADGGLGTVSAIQAVNLMSSAVGLDPNQLSTVYDEVKYSYTGLLSPAAIQAHINLAGFVMAKLIEREIALPEAQRVIFEGISLSGGWRTVTDANVETLANRLSFRVNGELPSPETIAVLVETFNSMKSGYQNNNTTQQRDLFKAIGALILGQAGTLLG